ncbi:MAG: hypothetical protein HY815_29065 [Candidatus Riflebacteria bacterium]|nr:hypothetical protein [Candidatus Riflebacteria bacterium]
MDTGTIKTIIENHRGEEGQLAAILTEVQRTCGHVSEMTLGLVATEIGCSLAQARELADALRILPLRPDQDARARERRALSRSMPPLVVRCHHCNHSLLDRERSIDGRPAVGLTASFDQECCSILISAWRGSFHVESEIELPLDGVVNFFCPHCHTEMVAAESCQECGSPLVPTLSDGRTMDSICPDGECRSHGAPVRVAGGR